MTWEWIILLVIVGGLIFIEIAIGQLQHETKRCADSLVEIERTLRQIENYLGGIDSDLTRIRKQTTPTAWDE